MTFQTIPLDKLALAASNVRRTAVDMNLDELAASIAAHGLLQNLSVRALLDESGEATGRYEVVAGGRRFRALKRLAKTKKIKKSHPVPCALIGGFSDTEIGLAENLYCPMHPADQYQAWARLAAEGQSPADIAARFGVSEPTVQQRLRLGKVSPKLLDLYREGAMTLDTLMAFTLSDDHEEQERIWAELPEWNRQPEMVRRSLTKAHVAASEPIARFVGIESYETAGGRVLRDLFDERRTWLLDRAVLDRLASGKLEAEAEKVRAEGWRWVQAGFGYPQDTGARRRIYPTPRAPTPEETEKRARLESRLEEVTAILDSVAKEDALAAEAEEIERGLAELDSACDAFNPEQKAIAGAVVWLDHDGALAIDRGLVRRADEPQPEPPEAMPHVAASQASNSLASLSEADAPAAPPVASTSAEPEKEELKPLSDRLIEDLTAHRTAGLRLALADNPEIALVAMIHALAARLFYGRTWDPGSCLDIQPREPYLEPSSETIKGSAVATAFEEARTRWRATLPYEEAELWDWLIVADHATRLDLLAFCAGAAVDATRKRNGHPGRSALTHADQLALALGFDLREHWSPSQERFLAKVSKRHILAALAEVAGEAKARAWEGLKKEALVEMAEPILTEARWLPELLRTPAPKTGGKPIEDAGDGTEASGTAEEQGEAESCAMAAE